jgi:hypothetical protein
MKIAMSPECDKTLSDYPMQQYMVESPEILDIPNNSNLMNKKEIVERSFQRNAPPKLNLKIETKEIDHSSAPVAIDWEELVREEDQLQKIERLLKYGDSILEIINGARLIGLELIEGITLVCQDNIYLVDNYFKRENGI